MSDNKISEYKYRQPCVSVILPVYNGKTYLKDAIECILNQTYSNFEFIIIDDGSTDNPASIVSSFTDPRIIFYSQKNKGLAATLNVGITIAGGDYIARHDQDDISLPDRFYKQVEFLDANPFYGMVGTWSSIWEETKPTERFHKHHTDNVSLKFDLLFDNAFVHSSLMIRKSVFNDVGFYSTDTDRQPPEDYELWSRVVRKFKVANIPEILHVYREIPRSMSRTGNNPFLQHLLKINAENLAWITGGKYSDLSLNDIAAVAHGSYSHFSGKTSWKEMLSIVREAADLLCKNEGVQPDIIQENLRLRINSLRYHYNQAKYFRFLGDSGIRIFTNTLRTGKIFFNKIFMLSPEK